MGKKQELSPSEQLTNFLNFIDASERAYQTAWDEIKLEEKRLQDLLHEIELASCAAERNRAAASLQKSRQRRRENKDVALLYKDKGHRDTLNRMRQLLGRQRKEEDYLQKNRIYHPRITESPKG